MCIPLSWTHNPGRMVCTLAIQGRIFFFFLNQSKISRLEARFITVSFVILIRRTLRPSVEYRGGGGGGRGGTYYPRGGQFALVQNVLGDIVH